MHECQRTNAVGDNDPNFANIYRKNPWCWSEDLGFHRSKKPSQRLYPELSKGSKFVSPTKIQAQQAVRLGAGAGTSNHGGARDVLGESLARVIEIAQIPAYKGDPELWARYGSAAKGKDFDESLSQIQDVVRIMLTELILVDPSFPNRASFDRLVAGRPTSQDLAILSEGEYSRNVVDVLVNGHCYGGVTRQINRLYFRHGKVSQARTDAMVEALIEYLSV